MLHSFVAARRRTRGRVLMVYSHPDPFVLCPQCRQLNFLPQAPRTGSRYDVASGKRQCERCRTTLLFSGANVLPKRHPSEAPVRWEIGNRCSPCYSIYLIVNRRNGMIYVGRTRGYLTDRMYLHVCHSRRLTPKSSAISRAIHEFGEDAFDMFLLEEALSNQNEDKEREYICRLKACDPRVGYNRSGCRTVEEANVAYAKALELAKAQWALMEKWPY